MNQSHHLRLTQDTSVGTIRFMYNIRVLLITICLFVFFLPFALSHIHHGPIDIHHDALIRTKYRIYFFLFFCLSGQPEVEHSHRRQQHADNRLR